MHTTSTSIISAANSPQFPWRKTTWLRVMRRIVPSSSRTDTAICICASRPWKEISVPVPLERAVTTSGWSR